MKHTPLATPSGIESEILSTRLLGLGVTALRVIGALGGSYAVCAAWVALLGISLAQLGLARSEAVVLAAMSGFVLYLGVVLWAFSQQSVLRLWAVMSGSLGLAGALALGLMKILG
jgi:uncharacterized membrane protein YedE/YeeE